MKTQLHFNIDSTEITEQITAAITAEMKHIGREVADKAFADALEAKIKSILERLDQDVKNNWYGSSTKQLIIDTTREAINSYFTNNNEYVNGVIVETTERYLRKLSREANDVLVGLSKSIDQKIDERVKEYLGTAVLNTLFKKD